MLCDTIKYHMVNVNGNVTGVCLATDVDEAIMELKEKCIALQKNIDELCAIHAIEEDRMFADCKHAKYMLWCKRAESARWAMLRYKALHAFGDISRYGLDGYVHKGFAGKVNHTAYEWLIIWFKVMTLSDKKVLEYKDIVE